MEKIVVLNSGGFDSTTLLADLASYKKYEIHSLYFSYGQLNGMYDSKCARENAEKLGAYHYEVKLPEFNWSKSNFYKSGVNEYQSQYLEMRNVIFISYALSLAESIGATSIYAAILGNGNYKDTNAQFLKKMKELCENLGFNFIVPYETYKKEDLFIPAKILGVGTLLNYFSCDTPDCKGNPCEHCADCKSLKPYQDNINSEEPAMQFYMANFKFDDRFKELFRKYPIREMRVVLNNSCQLHCEHCYHGDNELLDPILTDEELVNTILDARNLGIKSIHFAGKEPLYDDRIFRIINLVKDRGVNDLDFSVVTNAINVPKYAESIKSSGISKVFLSADDEYGGGEHDIRHNAVNAAVKRAILALNGVVPVEIFLDLTPYNIKNVMSNIKYWETWGVESFHIRTIRFVGRAEDSSAIPIKDLCELHHQLKNYNKSGLHINLDIGAFPYAYEILSCDEDFVEEIQEDVQFMCLLGTVDITDIYSLLFELYCGRYENQITLTPDGYVLGCAMECSIKDYNRHSAGNIRTESLKEIILRGKNKTLKEENCSEMFKKCSFTPIDI